MARQIGGSVPVPGPIRPVNPEPEYRARYFKQVQAILVNTVLPALRQADGLARSYPARMQDMAPQQAKQYLYELKDRLTELMNVTDKAETTCGKLITAR